jgi:hypothetical protein
LLAAVRLTPVPSVRGKLRLPGFAGFEDADDCGVDSHEGGALLFSTNYTNYTNYAASYRWLFYQ